MHTERSALAAARAASATRVGIDTCRVSHLSTRAGRVIIVALFNSSESSINVTQINSQLEHLLTDKCISLGMDEQLGHDHSLANLIFSRASDRNSDGRINDSCIKSSLSLFASRRLADTPDAGGAPWEREFVMHSRSSSRCSNSFVPARIDIDQTTDIRRNFNRDADFLQFIRRNR